MTKFVSSLSVGKNYSVLECHRRTLFCNSNKFHKRKRSKNHFFAQPFCNPLTLRSIIDVAFWCFVKLQSPFFTPSSSSKKKDFHELILFLKKNVVIGENDDYFLNLNVLGCHSLCIWEGKIFAIIYRICYLPRSFIFPFTLKEGKQN